jgi:hypothetical protein
MLNDRPRNSPEAVWQLVTVRIGALFEPRRLITPMLASRSHRDPARLSTTHRPSHMD